MELSDLMFYDDDRVKKFIKKNRGVLDDRNYIGKCNTYSVEIVHMLNEKYSEKYVTFQKVAYAVWYFIKNNDELEYGFGCRLMNIIQSVKKQFLFWCKVKNIVKRVPLEEQDYKSIKRGLNNAIKRFDYLWENILPEYLYVTPAYSYMKNLEKNGKSIKDDVSEFFEFQPYQNVDESQLQKYCEYIQSQCDDDSWKENLMKYNETQKRRLGIIQNEKALEKAEKLSKKYEDTLSILEYHGRIFYKNFMVAGKTPQQGKSMAKIGMSVSEFDKKGESCKVVLLMRNGCRSSQSVKFFCKNAENYMSCMSKATVIGNKEKLPAELEELINEGKIASCEIVLN